MAKENEHRQEVMERFKVGDAVVHPAYGAGRVVGIEERRLGGSNKLHYNIELLTQPGTNLIIPLGVARARGVRPAISEPKLEHVWRVLGAEPQALPADHKARHKLLLDKLHTGEILKIAEMVRDVILCQTRKGYLAERDRRLCQKGMNFLVGEIAATLSIDLDDARLRAWAGLRKCLQPDAEQEAALASLLASNSTT